MYTVIVADDETELRQSLVARTPWTDCGFEIIGEASNGAEALEMVERLQPDLLLTDIRMPFLSGIALARGVREVCPATQIAFLSGYDEFAYAQQAIQYNIIRYMLKPISSEELVRQLREIHEEMKKQREEIAHGRVKHLHPNDFVIPLLLGAEGHQASDDAEERLCARALECGLLVADRTESCFSVLAVAVLDEQGTNITTRASIHAVDMVLKKYVKAVTCFLSGHIVSLIASSKNDNAHYLHIAVGEIQQSISKAMGEKCCVGVSQETDRLLACCAAYHEAVRALEYVSGNDGVQTACITDFETPKLRESDFTQLVDGLSDVIKNKGKNDIEAYIKRIFGELSKGGYPSFEANLVMMQLTSTICQLANTIVGTESANRLWHENPLMPLLNAYRTYEEMQNALCGFCIGLKDEMMNQRRENRDNLCEKAIALIEKNYQDEDLSLVSLGKMLHISPNYLSTLIRKQTGETFISLLTAKRLNHACDLLQYTADRVQEIASKCGYSDQHYFSYCFKKRFGMSPIAMRRQQTAAEERV